MGSRQELRIGPRTQAGQTFLVTHTCHLHPATEGMSWGASPREVLRRGPTRVLLGSLKTSAIKANAKNEQWERVKESKKEILGSRLSEPGSLREG